MLKASTLALTIQAVAQFSGANAISAYAVSMSKSVGFLTEPYIAAVTIATLRITGSLLSLFVLRSVGRLKCQTFTNANIYCRRFKLRGVMITTSMVMAVALATASVLLMCKPELDKDLVAFGSIACIGVYLTAFSSGAGAIPWFLPGELLPTEVSIPLCTIHQDLMKALYFTVSQRCVRTVHICGLPFNLFLPLLI